MSMHRTYVTDTGLIAVSATGLTPVLYFSVPAAADANIFKMIPSVEVDASVPTVPSNSDINFSLFKVTGAVGGGAALTPVQLEGNVLASNLTVKSGSTALTGLAQGAFAGWSRTIPFTAGAFSEADHENSAALETPLLPSTNYAVYMRVPAGPGAGTNMLVRVVPYWAE
jgi:hypothetical protein